MIATNGAALASVLLGVVVLSGQEPTAPTFEVASVKRNNTSELGRQGALFRENINTTKGTDTLRNVTLNSCIKWAYGLQDPQISGPDWIAAERYDIVAKSSGPTSEGQLRLYATMKPVVQGRCGRAGAALSPKARIWRSWPPFSPIHCGRQS